MWSPSGTATTPARTSPTVTCSSSPGPPGRTAGARPQAPTPTTPPTQPPHDRARGPFGGIDEQVPKAEKAVAGKAPIKRNRFIQLSGDTHTVNRELEANACTLAGIKGYTPNLAACPDGTPVTAEFVIG